MRVLVLKAYWKLILFDLYSLHGNFNAFYDDVRRYPCANRKPSTDTVERICAAVDMACIWYVKQALCLQRSAAATWLLRDYGIAAQLTIGAQGMPLKTHAWVEVDGHIVNDKSDIPVTYSVMARC